VSEGVKRVFAMVSAKTAVTNASEGKRLRSELHEDIVDRHTYGRSWRSRGEREKKEKHQHQHEQDRLNGEGSRTWFQKDEETSNNEREKMRRRCHVPPAEV